MTMIRVGANRAQAERKYFGKFKCDEVHRNSNSI